MTRWLDSGDFAGLSAALAYYFVVGAVGLGILIWRHRQRFYGWRGLTQQERADCILHVGLFGIVANAAFQRTQATYSFAVQEWRLSNIAILTAPIYLGLALVSMAAFLWWLVLEIVGPSTNRVWWLSLILAGAWLGSAVSWRF
jgi:protein-S-isoprenylcysteine O-methyltransferase Ste14